MNPDRRMRWLDDRAMELMHLDSAIRLGRIQGEGAAIERLSGKPFKYERTHQYRLMRHYEREYNRIRKGAAP